LIIYAVRLITESDCDAKDVEDERNREGISPFSAVKGIWGALWALLCEI